MAGPDDPLRVLSIASTIPCNIFCDFSFGGGGGKLLCLWAAPILCL